MIWPFRRKASLDLPVTPLPPALFPSRQALATYVETMEHLRVTEALAEREKPVAEIRQRLAAMQSERDALLVNVLYDEAENLGHRYKEAVEEVARIYTELLGLNNALGQFKNARLDWMVPRPIIGVRSFPGIVGRLVDRVISAPGLQLHALKGAPVVATVQIADIAAAAGRWGAVAQRLVQPISTSEEAP